MEIKDGVKESSPSMKMSPAESDGGSSRQKAKAQKTRQRGEKNVFHKDGNHSALNQCHWKPFPRELVRDPEKAKKPIPLFHPYPLTCDLALCRFFSIDQSSLSLQSSLL